ncbi:S1/P1 nuclease [Syncephalis fuscata]|nr:S1/P1 nuclease [Syncephalis fuscata]
MFKPTILFFVCSVFLFSIVDAWKEHGHAAIGLVTQRLLADNVRNNLQQLLDFDDYSHGDFGLAANWADTVKLSKTYAWSFDLHFVDMGPEHTDDTCRDYLPAFCPGNRCIVGALQNYTNRLRCDAPFDERTEALKFLLHFLGDVSQPLHSGGFANGGNDLNCLWESKSTNLHMVWDKYIIDKTIDTRFNGSFDKYLDQMEQDIRVGRFAKWHDNWLRCFKTPTINIAACAINWVNTAHHFDCRYVFPTYTTANATDKLDLSIDYYRDNAERVDTFIARAIVRSAHLLNSILGNCSV